MSEYETHQRKILHLVTNNPELAEDFAANAKPEYFSIKYRPLAVSIRAMHVRGMTLTKNAYMDFISKACESGEYKDWIDAKDSKQSKNMVVIAESTMFSEIANTEHASKNDFDFYISKLKEHYVRQRANDSLSDYNKTAKSNIYKASAELAEKLKGLAGEADAGTARVLDGAEFGEDEWLKNLEQRRKEPEERLLTGFPEIDYSIGVGLKPGMLTLFVADVGGFKTTMMLNVALNIFKQYGKNVLMVPLEMPAEMLFHKVISRESKVELRKIEHADRLSDSEFEKVKREVAKWNDIKHRFVMLDPIDRLRVSDIKKLIEQNYAWFKPDVVIVDYISILRPEVINERAPTHEQIGHMCKDLRQLGRSLGFSVISAAQLSRDAIKKHRKEKEGQQTVGSEDVRGSHDFSADSDNIFAQVPMPSQPNEKLQVFCIKSRYGSKTFPGGKPYAVLNVAPEIGRISSEEDATWECLTPDDSVKHAESMIDDIDMIGDLNFDDEDDNAPPSSKNLSTDEIFSEPEKKDNLNVLTDDFDI
tara:strand:+ start:23381 stop:24976 length:1596 start_codon:yes stop_codon:yes gene_type:complete